MIGKIKIDSIEGKSCPQCNNINLSKVDDMLIKIVDLDNKINNISKEISKDLN